jgi:hypothetical protein
VNGGFRRTSARIQGARRRRSGNDGVIRRREEQEDNAMMRRVAAGLLATALIAGPAFAASSAGDAGKSSATATAGSGNSVENQTKPDKTAKTHHARKHVVRHKGGKATRHVARLKTHRRQLATHVAKPTKVERAGKSDKS